MRLFKGLIKACLAVAVLTGTATVALPVLGADEEDEYLGLPEAPGREEVAAYCGACHSLKIVVQQGLTRNAWEETLQWMYDEQEMPELDKEEEKLVLDYLAKYVSPESQKERLRQQGIIN